MNPHEMLTDDQSAEFLGVTPKTMKDWRFDGFGPPFYQSSPKGGAGHRTRYRRADLEVWKTARANGFTLRQSTKIVAKAAEALDDQSALHMFKTDPELAAAQRRLIATRAQAKKDGVL